MRDEAAPSWFYRSLLAPADNTMQACKRGARCRLPFCPYWHPANRQLPGAGTRGGWLPPPPPGPPPPLRTPSGPARRPDSSPRRGRPGPMSSPGRQGRSVPAGALPQEFLAARQDQKSREESESTRMTEAQGPKEMEGIKYSAQENSDAPCRPGLVAMRESKRRMTDGREVPQERQQGPTDPTDRMDALIRDAVEP